MSSRALIANFAFNPPVISLIGGVKESTVEYLNEVLPNVCSTTNTGNVPFALEWHENPPRWQGELRTHFASEEIGQSHMFVTVLDALEREGGWSLIESTANNDEDTGKVHFKFFFTKRGAFDDDDNYG